MAYEGRGVRDRMRGQRAVFAFDYGGVFAQHTHRAGTAPIITLFIWVIPLKTTHLQKHACSIPKLCN